MDKIEKVSATALKLKTLRNRAGLSVRAVGASIGMPPTTYASYEDKFKKPFIPVELAKKLAEVFAPRGVGKDEVLALAGIVASSQPEPQTPAGTTCRNDDGAEYVRIPVYDRFATDGGGQPAFHYMSMGLLRTFSDAPADHLAFVRVTGDSMEPLLFDGDLALVDTSPTRLSAPAIYGFVMDGGVVIKHASRRLDTGAVTLISHNPRYEPQTVSGPDKLHILGRIVFSIRKL